MTIGEKIKKLRLDLGLTQEELAKAVGTQKQTIHKYETGIIANIPASKIETIEVRLFIFCALLYSIIAIFKLFAHIA